MISRFLTLSVLALLSADAFAGEDCKRIFEARSLSCDQQRCWYRKEIPAYIDRSSTETKTLGRKTITLLDTLRTMDWTGLRSDQTAAKQIADGANIGGCPNCAGCVELARDRESALSTMVEEGFLLLTQASDACRPLTFNYTASSTMRADLVRCAEKLRGISQKEVAIRAAVQSALQDGTGDCTRGASPSAAQQFNNLAAELNRRHESQKARIEKDICERRSCDAAISSSIGTQLYAAVNGIARTSSLDGIEAEIMTGVRAWDLSKAAPLPPETFDDYVNRIVMNRHALTLQLLTVKERWPNNCR